MNPVVEAAYGHRVRVRVGALIFDEPEDPSSLLLVEHDGIHDDEPFWTPAGGGIDFGESLTTALSREVREETGLEVRVDKLRYVLDFVRPPLHTVSFYFEARIVSGELKMGTDPELGGSQLIRSVRFMDFADLPGLTVYPEPLRERVASDARRRFPEGTVYLGTLR